MANPSVHVPINILEEPLGSYSTDLKPMPKSDKDIRDEAEELGLSPFNSQNVIQMLQYQPRINLIAAIYEAPKIKRSPKQFSLLIVGPTGSGKSSTVNHLFGSGDIKTDIKATVSQTGNESETRTTSEYVLMGDSLHFAVCDLELGIVDTPGFPDTDGIIQDAFNFASIKKFYNLHPNLKGYYPNVILILARCIDQCGGSHTPFVKSLRYLVKLDLVDKIRPNVVGILTFPCSIKPNYDRNYEKWEEKLEQRRIWIQDKIFEVLSVTAPVVVIENHFEDEELVRPENGDYTKLPNGELQPRNLFIAANSILKSNNDILGQTIFQACFVKPKPQLKLGFSISIKENRVKNWEDLSQEEKDSISFIVSDTQTGMDHPIFLKALEFIYINNLVGEDKRQIQEIAVKLIYFVDGLSCDLKDIPPGVITYHMDSKITAVGSKFLTSILAVKEIKNSITSPLIGQGYNILTDKPTSGDILDITLKSSQYSIMIPVYAKLEKVSETRNFEEYFNNAREYIKYRLNNLNLNFNVDSNIFNMQSRAGFNDLSKMPEVCDKTMYSFLYEKRLFKLKMGNFDRIPITDDFRLDVENLPTTYDKNEQSNRDSFQMFFDRWGHFIVTSAYGGGYIEMKSTQKYTEVSSQELKNDHVQGSLTSIFYGKFGVSGNKRCGSGVNTSSHVSQNSFNCVGGNLEYHNEHILEDPELMIKWQQSLITDPMMLTTELSLEPISTIIGFVVQRKQEACYNALKDLLGGEIVKTIPQLEHPNEQEDEDFTREKTGWRYRPKLPNMATVLPALAALISIGFSISKYLVLFW